MVCARDASQSKLPTGRYDYDYDYAIMRRYAQDSVRTIRGAPEVVNRAEGASGETEFDRRCRLTWRSHGERRSAQGCGVMAITVIWPASGP